MIIEKYRVQVGVSSIEFKELAFAQAYCQENSIPLDSIEDVSQEFPDLLSQGDDVVKKVVPCDISRRQVRLALVLTGKSLTDVATFLDALPSPQKELAWIDWETSSFFPRDNPLLVQAAGVMGLSASELDDFFIFAKTL